MNKRNKLFFRLLILGFIAIIIGAYLKINGNENAYILLVVGMLFKSFAIVCLIVYNFQNKKTFKDMGLTSYLCKLYAIIGLLKLT